MQRLCWRPWEEKLHLVAFVERFQLPFQEAHTATNELFGLKRTLDFVKERRDLAGSQIIEDLRSAVCDFVGSRDIADDMSAIIVRRLE